jgi:hypothetical protein
MATLRLGTCCRVDWTKVWHPGTIIIEVPKRVQKGCIFGIFCNSGGQGVQYVRSVLEAEIRVDLSHTNAKKKGLVMQIELEMLPISEWRKESTVEEENQG